MGPPPARREPSGAFALAEELHKGVAVLYNGGVRGIVHTAYAPIDEFWVTDEASGELVRGDDGAALAFASKELQLVSAPEPKRQRITDNVLEGGVGSGARSGGSSGSAARVLVIGPEHIMLEILQHFGRPDVSERREPSQQLLAVPCVSCECGGLCSGFDPWSREMCDEDTCPVSRVAKEGVEEGILELAQRMRPDISVRVRPYHLKQAIDQIGSDLRRLRGFYCLSVVTVPFGNADIDASEDSLERRWRQQVRCQLDLGVSADGVTEPSDRTAQDTAKRTLAEFSGVRLSSELWSEATQLRVRRHLGVDLPLSFQDGPSTKVFVLVIPENAEATLEGELLHFHAHVPEAPAAPPRAAAQGLGVQEAKTHLSKEQASWSAPEWANHQDLFKDLPKLPTGWIRVRSKSSGDIYYWDTRTNKPTFDFPLPDGWTKQVSKSNGKVYYFNAAKRQSMYTVPTE